MKYNSMILTHSLTGNYGGMLQAYAIKVALDRCSGKSWLIYDYYPNSLITLKKKYILNVKILILFFLSLIFKRFYTIPYWLRLCVARKFKKSLRSIHESDFFSKKLLKVENASYVVGSDQVWRCVYTRYMVSVPFFFLNFATKEQRNNSIAYAASFGSDHWEGTEEETAECARLTKDFKAISVREHSGVKICKEVFGVDAVQMPDPTLLLNTSDYDIIINSEITWMPDGNYTAAYVLDETEGKAELLQEGASAMNLHLQHLMPHANAKKRRDRFPISVPQWLRLIRDCEYFITDSFHGCVFAIIYNKPFVCLGNEGRGNARFDTLLGTFGLEDRLVTDATPENVLQVLNAPIDWERVNAIHDSERERGINFLKENLSES